MAHEKVHSDEQGDNPQRWWDRYLIDNDFRLDQEVKAYRRQYQYICSQNRNRNFQFTVLMALSLTLAGPMYGYLVQPERAVELISNRV